MRKTLCGADCDNCFSKGICRGCEESNYMPFGIKCTIAEKIKEGAFEVFYNSLLSEINSLNIEGLGKVEKLYYLKGSFVNMEFILENGNKTKFLCDDKIYLCNQHKREGTNKCLGIACDEKIILVCEYGEDGKDAKLLCYKERT